MSPWCGCLVWGYYTCHSHSYTLLYSGVVCCSVGQCSVVLCSVVMSSVVQCSVVLYSLVLLSVVQYSYYCSVLQYPDGMYVVFCCIVMYNGVPVPTIEATWLHGPTAYCASVQHTAYCAAYSLHATVSPTADIRWPNGCLQQEFPTREGPVTRKGPQKQ